MQAIMYCIVVYTYVCLALCISRDLASLITSSFYDKKHVCLPRVHVYLSRSSLGQRETSSVPSKVIPNTTTMLLEMC